ALCLGRRRIVSDGRGLMLLIAGLSEPRSLTNEAVFSLTELPPRLAVIGAGPIGCELAQAFARFGSHVTLLEVLPQLLSKEDQDAAAIVEAALRRDGVDLLTGVDITGRGAPHHQHTLHLE